MNGLYKIFYSLLKFIIITYQNLMEIESPNIKSMWGCMFAGDMAIENVKKKSILIVGDSRIGKSTLFNYLSGVNLIGVYDQEEGDVTLKSVHSIGVDALKTFESVTLIPNLTDNLQNNEEIGLIDTAGLGDEGRSYAGKFGVSYMLQKIFQNINEVKFMICVSHPLFALGSIKGILEPFLRFVEMLGCENLIANEDTAEKFYNSISIVITKSQMKTDQYLTKLRNAITHLQKDKNIDNEKKVVKAILQSVFKNKRLTGFQQGQDGVQLPRSQILQYLNLKNWQFYDLKNQAITEEYLIKLPFEKTFAEMAQKDVDSYKKDTEAKHKLMKKSYQLLKRFIKRATVNWYSQEPIDYSQQFNQLQSLIQDHPYGNFESMINFLKLQFTIAEYQTKNVVRTDLINQIKNINSYAQKIDQKASNQSETFNKIIKMQEPCFTIFDLSRKTFCKSRSEERKFLTFMFINMRSLYECQMQSKIHKGESSAVPFIITGGMSQLLPESIWDLIANFLTGFNAVTDQQKQTQMKLIQDCLAHMNEMSSPEKVKQLIYFLIKNYLKLTNNLIKQNKYFEGLNYVFKASRQLKNYMSLMPSFDDMPEKDQCIIQFKEIQIFKKIGQCLQGMKLHAQAIKIYKHIEAVSLVIKCYQDWIKITKKKKSKIHIMQPYIEFLENYGKNQKVIQLYERMIDQFQCYPKKRMIWKSKLGNLLKNQLSVTNYANMLKQKAKSLEDSDLICKIQSELTYYVADNEDVQSSEEDIEETFNSFYNEMEAQEQEQEQY